MEALRGRTWQLRAKALELASRYEELVVRDPDLARRLEAGLRFASYVLPGGSWELSEIAYCVVNLYSLLNDYIITRRCPKASKLYKLPSSQRVLLWVLAVVECVEVVMEVGGEMGGREPGKWTTVISIQCTKAALRAVLVLAVSGGLLTSPPVPSPDRQQAKDFVSLPQINDGQPLAWQATRTGKVVRSLHTDPSIPYSQLQHHVSPSPLPSPSLPGLPCSRLSNQQILAELLYLCRPLTHLLSMFIYSQRSWKPWLISLAIDLISLQLHGGFSRRHSKNEKSEIVRRRVLLLLYLLRAPFYDHYTKGILLKVLSFLSSTLPLVHIIVDPLLSYIPVWQSTYCYNWMT